MTLIELMIAMVLMITMAGVLSTLALAMRQGWEHSSGYATATQHARVALERISRAVSTATATDDYPGFYVVYQEVGSDRFPETLVVWNPTGSPANSNGPPLVSECVFFCPDPTAPNRLLEVRAPGDNRTIPLDDTLNTSTWRSTLAAIKTAASSETTVLTDMLRTASPSAVSTSRFGAARFVQDMRPTAADWTNPSLTWQNLTWPQHMYSQDFGVRQVWVRIELQLVPGGGSATQDTPADLVAPFFGSAALTYSMKRADR